MKKNKKKIIIRNMATAVLKEWEFTSSKAKEMLEDVPAGFYNDYQPTTTSGKIGVTDAEIILASYKDTQEEE